MSQLGGGIGTRGPGETKLETDRRKINLRIDHVKEQLDAARMFATLDPKLKQLRLPSRRRILLSDTVGFIRNLPHTLVTNFRATFVEVERAEVLVHVRDAFSPMFDEQKVQVKKVLAELEVLNKPFIEVLNKIDLLPTGERTSFSGVETVAASGLTGEGMAELLAAIDRALISDPLMEKNFRLPQSEGNVLASLEAGAVVSAKLSMAIWVISK